MPRIPYRYPPAGTDSIADAIRERRGARGLTPLDGMLLNAPQIAQGWNTLLGAIRTRSDIPDDVREIMILRVAIRNRAAFEWIQHEPVAKNAGVTVSQLARIGDISPSVTTSDGVLSPLQAAAVAFADSMTCNIAVPDSVFQTLRTAFKESGVQEGTALDKHMVESVATVATYNMVSRFLVATDVNDMKDTVVPVPEPSSSQKETSSPAAPLSYPNGSAGSPSSASASRGLVQVQGGYTIATRVSFHSMTAPWVVLVNSLMTDLTMWDRVLSTLSTTYNVLTYDQRGHGSSQVPEEPCSLDSLADDIANLLDALSIPKAHCVIGVSQGGATVLTFAMRHPERSHLVVACDTQSVSPAANAKAWDERIELAQSKGMGALADATVPRWFAPESGADEETRKEVHEMVARTHVKGFEQGARALQGYDLEAKGLLEVLKSRADRTLLVAGELDGKLPEVLQALAGKVGCTFARIPKAGHLPMIDQPQKWSEAVLPWIAGK